MAEVKHTAKTAESTGFQNVAPGPNDQVVVDTTARQAAATVPGSVAAAAEAVPSDEVVGKLLEAEKPQKTFRDTVREREDALLAGVVPSNEAYPQPVREVKPSKRVEVEQARGAKAQADAAQQQSGSPVPADVASRSAKEANRNKEAEEQVERVTGEEAADKKAKK